MEGRAGRDGEGGAGLLGAAEVGSLLPMDAGDPSRISRAWKQDMIKRITKENKKNNAICFKNLTFFHSIIFIKLNITFNIITTKYTLLILI